MDRIDTARLREERSQGLFGSITPATENFGKLLDEIDRLYDNEAVILRKIQPIIKASHKNPYLSNPEDIFSLKDIERIIKRQPNNMEVDDGQVFL